MASITMLAADRSICIATLVNNRMTENSFTLSLLLTAIYDRKRLILSSVKVDDLAVGKQVLFMFMIASLASGGLALLLAAAAGSQFLMFSMPGFIIGAFFAYKYAVYDKKRAREEEHRRRRNKH